MQAVLTRIREFRGSRAAFTIGFISLLTTLVPLLAHHRRSDCWLVCHVVNLETYHFTKTFNYNGDSLWDLFAIFQASVVSLSLLLEIPDAKGAKKPAVIAAYLIALAVIAIYALGSGQLVWYQVSILILAAGFLLEDYLLFHFGLIEGAIDNLLYVDIPYLLALGVVTWYVGIPIRGDSELFFSGAIAFQLVMGNILLFVIRVRNTFFIRPPTTSPRQVAPL